MKSKKYVYGVVHFPGKTIADDTQVSFCINGVSTRKAVQVGKQIAGERMHTGYVVRQSRFIKEPFLSW